jgi:hypothetical protein
MYDVERAQYVFGIRQATEKANLVPFGLAVYFASTSEKLARLHPRARGHTDIAKSELLLMLRNGGQVIIRVKRRIQTDGPR